LPVTKSTKRATASPGRVGEVREECGNREKAWGWVEPSGGAIASPWQLRGLGAEICLDRVPDDVANSPEELLLALPAHCPKAVPKEVSLTAVAPVEAKRVSAVEFLHGGREAVVVGSDPEQPVSVVRVTPSG
jgi:hypothetical protein